MKPAAPVKATSAKAVIDSSSLPDSLKDATRRFVDRVQWRSRNAAALAQAVLRHLATQLELGASPDALAAQWADAIPLPRFQRLGEPSLVVIHSLPASVSTIVVDVVQRTRLWRSEQIDVARELITHFQDGIDAGQSADELIRAFGDVSTAAHLIRRAKLRNRNLFWRAARRTWQTVGVLLVVGIVWWTGLLIRFQFSRPTIAFDTIGKIDAISSAIPESDRAWPLYAKALTAKTDWLSFEPPRAADGSLAPEWAGLAMLVDVRRVDGRVVQTWPVSPEGVGAPSNTPGVQRTYRMSMVEVNKAIEEMHRGKHWPALVQYAEMNRQSIDLILKGAAKPKFGFVFRDPAHTEWLAATNEGTFDRFQESTQSLFVEVLLPHIQQSRSLLHLLQIELERARVKGERARVVEVLSTELRMAAQIDQADGIAITRLVGLVFANSCWSTLREILDEQPDFFANEDLQTLAHRLAAHRTEVDLNIHLNSKAFYDDLLQRLYSDDGQGNGHLTAEGWHLIKKVNPNKDAWPGQFQLEGSLLSGVVASRAELKQFLDRYCELQEEDAKQPLWEVNLDEDPKAISFLQKATATPTGQLKYRPLLLMEPRLGLEAAKMRPHVLGESAKMNGDATMIAVSLELYHRRHGTWPTSLDQLCPDLLPSVPIDRLDGKPMKYLIIDGKPTVYSVGRNKSDEGGQWSTEDLEGLECRKGDWRLVPFRKKDQ